jgi:hypothetical protein
LTQLLPALIFHFMNGVGTLAQHFFQLYQAHMADSSWSDRRARLPWQVFTQLMQWALRPLVQRRRHPEAFWRGWRLMATDGTQFSVANTPTVKATQTKARARRSCAAFVKIVTGVLLEVGLHNPVAAAIGYKGQSERELAMFALGDDLLEDWQKRQLTERFYAQARRCLSSKRRAHSCQPRWP